MADHAIHRGSQAGPRLSVARGGDTIAAAATAPGRGAIGIIRISGPEAAAIGRAIGGRELTPRHAHHAPFIDATGRIIDRGLVIFFPAPGSFTGEDVVELQGHGGRWVMDLLLGRVLELGARPARPGEFSERAFRNGRIDLAQAEAIADLIDAGTATAARSAAAALQGEFSARVTALAAAIDRLRAECEAAIDFADDDLPPDLCEDHRHRALLLTEAADRLLNGARHGALLRDGLRVVIAGRSNAGKSSLLNHLVGRERAIVSPIAGTTRDTVEVEADIGGVPVHLTDTAGLRDAGEEIEREGMRRARTAVAAADEVLLVVPDGEPLGDEDLSLIGELKGDTRCIIVRNKIDLTGTPAGVAAGAHGTEVCISATEGLGTDLLRAELLRAAGVATEATGGEFAARRRHLEALRLVRACVAEAGLEAGTAELMAEWLRQARSHLDTITGATTTEDLLAEIFAGFCIGK
jgi:tRNA modification GTPase